MKIYLVRHGETDWNQAGLLQGQTDIALNAQGLEQAREAAERLKEVPFEIAFCSPLIRAKRTAETIIGDRKITLTTDERLRELNFGPWEGVDIRSIKDAASQPFTNPGSYIPPEGAESFAQLYKRSGEFVDQVLLPLEGTYETVLVVAHGGVNRSILNPVLNIPVDDFWRVHMGNCATAILDCTDGKLSMLEYMDSQSANTKSRLL
jgi:probable phosphoglycerate mutase